MPVRTSGSRCVGDQRRHHHLPAGGDAAQPTVAEPVEQRTEAAGQEPEHDDEADAAAREAEQEPVARGTTPWNHSVLLRKMAPRMAPGTEPSPPTTTIVSTRMLSTGAKIASPRACWCEREEPARERGEEPRQREREQLGARRGEPERLGVALVLAGGDEVAHVARAVEPPHREQHEDQPGRHTK